MNKISEFINNYFKIKERNSTIKTEIFAGITSFFATCYILALNGNMFSNIPGVSFNAVYIGTSITTIIATFLMGILANLPLVVSTGLGINAFFIYSCCLSMGLTYSNTLLIIFFVGLVFIGFTVTGLRKILFDSLPKSIVHSISVGVGLLIVFIGLQSSNIIVFDNSTCVTLSSFNILKGEFKNFIYCFITIISLVSLIVFVNKKIKYSLFCSILIGTVIYYFFALIFPEILQIEKINYNISQAFSDFWNISCFRIFKDGMDFNYYLSIEGHNVTTLIITIISLFWTFIILSMFDTVGSIYSCCKVGGIIDEKISDEFKVPKMKEAMFCDAFGTTIGALFGTSNQTVYMESATGIEGGGRTGFCAVIIAILFVLAMILVPLGYMIPTCVFSSLLIYIGLLLVGNVKNINWSDPIEGIVAFITIVIMPFSYNVSYGIGFGVILYVLINVFMGQYKKINIFTWIVFVLFVVLIFGTH